MYIASCWTNARTDTNALRIQSHTPRRVFRDRHGRNHALLELLPVHGNSRAWVLPVARLFGRHARNRSAPGLAARPRRVRLQAAAPLRRPRGNAPAPER